MFRRVFLFVCIVSSTTGFDTYHDLLISASQVRERAKYFRKSSIISENVVRILEKSGDIRSQLSQLENVNNVTTPTIPVLSDLCLKEIDAVFDALLRRQNWAERMIDSAGKLPADILDGGITWLGDYDECIAVHSNLTDNLVKTSPFNGKYCLLGVPLNNNSMGMALQMGQPVQLQVGLCVPDGCTDTDTKILFNSALSSILGNSSAIDRTKTSVNCQDLHRKFDTKAVIVLVIVSLFISVMILATAYDVFYIQWQESKMESISGILNGEVNEQFQHQITSNESSPLLGSKPNTQYKPGKAGRILLSFSIYTNGAKILSTQQGAGTLAAVNGIRFISMSWVILGHTYVFSIANVDNVFPFAVKMFKRWSFGAILNALVSVDTFFTLSGLLLTYLVMKELKKKNGKLNWFMFYFHRFWRLTPPYMLILMVYVSLFPYIGSGPLWKKNGMEVNYCKDAWYYNILYINNFVNILDPSTQCMAWTWYLANDMQFFIISPLILLPLFYSKVIGSVVLLVFLLGSWITTGVISSTYNMKPSLIAGGDFIPYFDYYYIKPYCRIGPYLVGMLTGYLLYKTNCKCKINKYVNLCVWALAAGLAIVILYGLHDEVNGHPMSVDVAALYNTVHRTLWGACVCWVIFACATGNGGFVNTLLSWKLFVPLSRLTYCAYLVHPIVIYYFTLSQQRLLHFNDLTVIYLYLPNLCLSYAVAFIASLAFESPMMGLEKVVFKRDEKTE